VPGLRCRYRSDVTIDRPRPAVGLIVYWQNRVNYSSPLLLNKIRERAGKRQRQVADALGIKQPSLSKLEKQSDMQISTLRRIVNALGGELEVSAGFPGGTVTIEPFNELGSGEAVSR
jgi:DNA-binding XRE family transcriptional regulator